MSSTRQVNLHLMRSEFANMVEACKGVILVSVMAIHSRTTEDLMGNLVATREYFDRIERTVDGVRNAFTNGTDVTLMARLKGQLGQVNVADFGQGIQLVESRVDDCWQGLERTTQELRRESANTYINSLTELCSAVRIAMFVGTGETVVLPVSYFALYINDAFRIAADEQDGELYQRAR